MDLVVGLPSRQNPAELPCLELAARFSKMAAEASELSSSFSLLSTGVELPLVSLFHQSQWVAEKKELEDRLAKAEKLNADRESRLKEFEDSQMKKLEEYHSGKVQPKIDSFYERAGSAENLVKGLKLDVEKAIAVYKQSAEYRNAVREFASKFYKKGFKLCRKTVVARKVGLKRSDLSFREIFNPRKAAEEAKQADPWSDDDSLEERLREAEEEEEEEEEEGGGGEDEVSSDFCDREKADEREVSLVREEQGEVGSDPPAE